MNYADSLLPQGDRQMSVVLQLCDNLEVVSAGTSSVTNPKFGKLKICHGYGLFGKTKVKAEINSHSVYCFKMVEKGLA